MSENSESSERGNSDVANSYQNINLPHINTRYVLKLFYVLTISCSFRYISIFLFCVVLVVVQFLRKRLLIPEEYFEYLGDADEKNSSKYKCLYPGCVTPPSYSLTIVCCSIIHRRMIELLKNAMLQSRKRQLKS